MRSLATPERVAPSASPGVLAAGSKPAAIPPLRKELREYSPAELRFSLCPRKRDDRRH